MRSGLGNAEYGWGIVGRKDVVLSSIKLDEWRTPGGVGMIVSNLKETEQAKALCRLRDTLEKEVLEHIPLREHMKTYVRWVLGPKLATTYMNALHL